jgi:exonuclease III
MGTKVWNILCWNIRGLNSDKKWNAIRDRLTENNCDVLYLQETKHATFDLSFIRNFCPPVYDRFEFLPSNGASGGTIIIWKSSSFSGTLIFQNSFATSVELISLHNNATWILTNIYAPCTPSGKREFISWFKNIQMSDQADWLVVGDFNLYRSPEDRNREGADFTEMYMFNAAISALGLVELPLKGKRFTWTNKQHPPLLERLDWFFASASWTLSYPISEVSTLTMETSDHVPCLIKISTAIPKSHIFRFENYWLQREDFMQQVILGWQSNNLHIDAAKALTAKFKN